MLRHSTCCKGLGWLSLHTPFLVLSERLWQLWPLLPHGRPLLGMLQAHAHLLVCQLLSRSLLLLPIADGQLLCVPCKLHCWYRLIDVR